MKLQYIMYFIFLILFNGFSMTKTFSGLPPTNNLVFYTAPLIEIYLVINLFLKLINDYGNDNGYCYIIRFKNYNTWYKMMIKKGLITILIIILMQIAVIIICKLDLVYLRVVFLNLIVYIHLYIVIIFLNIITNNSEMLILYGYILIQYILCGVLNELGLNELFKVPLYLNINQIARYENMNILLIDVFVICVVSIVVSRVTQKILKEKKWKLN